MSEELEGSYLCLHVAKKNNLKCVGACYMSKTKLSTADSELSYTLDVFEFLEENDQFSNTDMLLVQLGSCQLFLSDEFENLFKGEGKKLNALLQNRENVKVNYVKNSFSKKVDEATFATKLLRIIGSATHISNIITTEYPLASICADVLISTLKLLNAVDMEKYLGKYELRIGSLQNYMRLDTAAADAVNLLPKPDHPSAYGSLFGILNRCKTKMGARLLERWIRQPLLDVDSIIKRQNFVEIFKYCTIRRNQLLDGPLKGLPDIDVILSKFMKNKSSLDEVFRIYVFVRSLPKFIAILSDMIDNYKKSNQDQVPSSDSPSKSHAEMIDVVSSHYIQSLANINEKFQMYCNFIEHVIDLDRLPTLVVNSQHDQSLQVLNDERKNLENEAEALLDEAKNDWASFADVKLEQSPISGLVFRTTKGDDERTLRANNPEVHIVSLKKNGVHFTTPQLKSISRRLKDIDSEYEELQQAVVSKIVETAGTYLPLVEMASSLVAEMDVIISFAQAAALAPNQYVRPVVHPKGSGILNLQGARHPCVELMDDVDFIPNNYNLKYEQSQFQIITGPNMGGKSTYIRGLGSILVMAQIGSFVPCTFAEVTVVDSILARVGAGDAVQKGVSTFMAEMLEASVILRTATENSLIIIDELGRGTSTFDGFGIAWALSEYIAKHIRCFCMFATHFHELTVMEKQIEGVVNRHVNAHITDGNVVMLYNVTDGPCVESFGIAVASMAHFPQHVLREAKRKASELENITEEYHGSVKFTKMTEVMEAFKSTDFNNIPMEDVRPTLQNLAKMCDDRVL